ncbi:MAG: alpha/beta fold hydrolase [Planctomycetota bacterium]|nr:alpha/beta fold hydrolase [Planctomycetota bacterium]
MTFPLLAALAFTLPTALVAAVIGLIRWLLGRPQRRYWRVALQVHLALFPLHLFVTFPAAIGYVGSQLIGTRGDEGSYAGPRVLPSGELQVQTTSTLRAERAAGGPALDDATLAAVAGRTHRVATSEGVALRVYCIEPVDAEPQFVALLVHGLFRSSMELEPVAKMLRQRGGEVWLMDQRNHGSSSRAPFTGGLRESDDVVAVVDYMRRQPGRAERPLVILGVSLGTVAVALALPRLDGVAGVVLDAPIDDLTAAAHRMMTFRRPGDRRSSLYMYEPWRSLIVTAIGWWSGFSMSDVRPIEVVATMPHDLPVLVVAEELDDRAPPDSVENMFVRMPQHEGTKELWRVGDVGHAKAFRERPAEYDEALGRLLARLRR